jgi:UDP-N-acetylmuramate--alanine ligase
MQNTKEFIVGCIDSPYVSSLLPSFRKRAETVSIKKEADWSAKDIRVEGGAWHFSVLKYGKMYGEYAIKLPGIQNITNALCCIAIANYIGVGEEIIEVALSEFAGVERRCHVLGEKKGILVIDDYAHHPTQIKATLEAIHTKYPDRKIWCIFQPHQHSRTRLFLKEFSKSFQYADVIIVADIYQARDTPQDIKRISSRDLVDALDRIGKAALYLPSFEEILSLVSTKINSNAILVTMGAGDIYNVAHSFLFE